MVLCIAGKNNIAVDFVKYVRRFYCNDFTICVIPNKTDEGEDTWQQSLLKYANVNKIRVTSLAEMYNENDLLFLSLEFDQLVDVTKFKTSRLYNIHFSFLPAYKGMYTSIFPILNNELYSGVTLHRIDNGIDTGEIIAQRRIYIDSDDTAFDLYLNYIREGTQLVIDYFDALLNETYLPQKKQENVESSYFSKRSIDFNSVELQCHQTAFQIDRYVRAFAFRPFQFSVFSGERIVDSRILASRSYKKPGTILEETEFSIKIATIDFDVLLYKDVLDELLEAIRGYNNEKARKICESKKLMIAKNKLGWSPLIVSTYCNNKEMFFFLLKNGCSIYDKNYKGTNLLMYAKDNLIRTGDITLLGFLLQSGLNPFEKDLSGKSLMDYCSNDKSLLSQIKKILMN